MGQPTLPHSRGSGAEFIGVGGETGRIETSKYPQEKKTNMIPPVVASEQGTG